MSNFTLKEAKRLLRLTDRAVKCRQGRLPGSSEYRHSVPIGTMMVETTKPASGLFDTTAGRAGIALAQCGELPPAFAVLTDATSAILHDTTTGEYELWFDHDGHAFIGFADKQDATMFRLALSGDLS